MSKRPNRICYTCGKKYHYCPTCGEDMNKPAYMTMWCGSNCYEINNILSNYTAKIITIEEAKNQLSKVNYDIHIEDQDVKNCIDMIMNSGTEINDEKKENEIKETAEEVVEKKEETTSIIGTNTLFSSKKKKVK